MRSPLREAGRLLQIPIELLCFSLTVVQSPFTTLSCLGVSKRDVLIARVIIHAYNQHVRLLSPEPLVFDKPSLLGSQEPALLCNQVKFGLVPREISKIL